MNCHDPSNILVLDRAIREAELIFFVFGRGSTRAGNDSGLTKYIFSVCDLVGRSVTAIATF